MREAFKVSFDHLHAQMNLITLSLENEIIFLEKSVQKVLNFGSKNLYEPLVIVFCVQVLAKRCFCNALFLCCWLFSPSSARFCDARISHTCLYHG